MSVSSTLSLYFISSIWRTQSVGIKKNDPFRNFQGAIGCFASITDSSVTTQIFIASLEKFHLIEDICERGKLESETNGSGGVEDSDATSIKKDANRYELNFIRKNGE